jgi:sulfur carrier protein
MVPKRHPEDDTMNIIVNGKNQSSTAENIAAYVSDSGLEPKTLVVEHNGNVIASDQWETTSLRDGDQLELLSFVGGG